jgi:signal transduction histidine kinase
VHCPGLVCLQVHYVLLTSDHVLARITPHQFPQAITPFAGLEHYFRSLAKIRKLEGINYALGGHEEPIWDLRSPVLERRSFPDALREVGARAIADRPVSLDVSVKGAPQACSPVVEQQLLLICQEALLNAVRHGAPRRVDVELEYAADNVSVRVSDDGRGFDPAAVEKVTGHYGVISMRERAAQVRGRLTIASAPGQGTRVETIIPVN